MSTIQQPTTVSEDLSGHFEITDEARAFFNEEGYVKLKHVLSRATLRHYSEEISNKVQELNKEDRPMEKRDIYSRAFLQVMNLWRHSDLVKEFVFGEKLARIAADLLDVDGVRLYHDQALYKEPSGGITPWHADQFYWPLSTDRTVTVWIPLQDTPLEMGPLAFAPKSHRITAGRDVAISEDSEKIIGKNLRDLQIEQVAEPYDLGEVSFHLGWTWHRAEANKSELPREVMTIIYMDKDIKLSAPKHKNHQADWDTWMPGVKIDETAASPLNPILWERS